MVTLFLSGYIACVAFPATGALLFLLWRVKHRFAQLAGRVALQCLIFCIALVPINLVSSRVQDYAIKVAQSRGSDIAARLERFRTMHGAYPETLEQMTREDKIQLLPPPTDPEGWGYSRQGHTYCLEFSGGFMRRYFFDGNRRVWLKD
jgi:hypothetical protein